MPLQYMCYLSRSKVDLLYQQIYPSGDEVRTETMVQTAKASATAAGWLPMAWAVLTGGLTFGRANTIQTERIVKRQYYEKLQMVLAAIKEQNGIPLMEDIGKSPHSIYFAFSGDFRIGTPLDLDKAVPSNKIVTIESRSANRLIQLDCTLQYFSDGNDSDGSFHFHSGNAAFFSGAISLRLETVAVLLADDGTTMRATPLFLALQVPSPEETPAGRPAVLL
jgi:hypothetical protein